MTITSEETTTTATASMEATESQSEDVEFLNLAETRQQDVLFAKEGSYSARLNGAEANKAIGPARSMKVYPGDKVNIEVYAKYVEPGGNNYTGVVAGLADMLTTAFTGATEATQLTQGFADVFAARAAVGGGSDTNPRAYLNYILFDKNYVPVDFGFQQVSDDAEGLTGPHERLALTADVQEEGYIYLYVSNESTESVNVFFDEMVVDYVATPVIQNEDYYPFGLTFNSFKREESTPNKYLFNGIERIDDLDLGWDLALYRSYDPAIGRWGQIDPKTSERESPYVGFANMPNFYIDPLGDTVIVNTTKNYSKTDNPKKYSDLGNTSDTGLSITGATKEEVDIEVNVEIDLSAAFVGSTPETNIEKQNPGLLSEVDAHEEGHRDQIVDAANQPITLGVEIDGEITQFSGRTDNVIRDAMNAFTSSKSASKMKISDVQSFLNNNIAMPALNKMSGNIDKVYRASNRESDANSRATVKLGRALKYNSNNLPKYKGKTLKNR